MKIGIDAREIQNGVYTGIGRPLANFLKYFGSLNTDDRCVLFSAQKIPLNFNGQIKNVVIPEKYTFLWDQWTLPQAIRREGVELFYSPYYKIPLMLSCKSVSAILDLMYLEFKPYRKALSPAARFYYKTFGRVFAHKADKILTCSQYSKNDIIRLYGVDAGKIEVIPLSVGDIYRVDKNPELLSEARKRWGIRGRYLLYVGNFKPHKNIPAIIDAFQKIYSRYPDLQLVLAGPKEFTYSACLAKVNQYQLHQRVIFLGKVTEQDQPHFLYNGAEAFVMPTLYEGFGLPPAEAMACGVPVIASNTTSIPEVVRDAGILIDPLDIEAIAEAMKKILDNPGLKEDLVRKGLSYIQEYNSTKLSAQTYDLFKRVYSGQ